MDEEACRVFANRFCGYVHTGLKSRRSVEAATKMLEDLVASGHDIVSDGSCFNCGPCWIQAIDWVTKGTPLAHPPEYVEDHEDRYNLNDLYEIHAPPRAK